MPLANRDADCIGCHTTGFGQPGGFAGTRRPGSQTDLIDVECEACHGPGAKHRRDGGYVTDAVESCVKCHTKEEDSDFNQKAAWEKIAH